MHVLTVMPTCLVNAAVRDLARLQAEESIRAANRVAMGSGKLKREDVDAIARQWEVAARPDGTRRKPDAGSLAARGFKVIRHKVPAKKK